MNSQPQQPRVHLPPPARCYVRETSRAARPPAFAAENGLAKRSPNAATQSTHTARAPRCPGAHAIPKRESPHEITARKRHPQPSARPAKGSALPSPPSAAPGHLLLASFLPLRRFSQGSRRTAAGRSGTALPPPACRYKYMPVPSAWPGGFAVPASAGKAASPLTAPG